VSASPSSAEQQSASTRDAGYSEGIPLGTPIAATEAELAGVKYDANGLVVSVVQDATSREVLMVAWMNAEALRRTLETGRTWCWSRSRQEYWCKGETSGDRQFVREVRYDCDGDSLLLLVDQEGRGACHTGERSCFYRAFGSHDSAG
jgi:phosphoribosyl-AMP cyclohydrolase/phosphoribosyl-ATP pyrophosphohydrolase/phosphoribosyl-AMP cyclohydrolase